MSVKAEKTDKKLLYCWVLQGFDVLVPKRRGEGFLKTPLGHHANEGLSYIEMAARCNLHGLDGALHFDCDRNFFGGEEQRKEFVSTVVPMLEDHYGLASEEIHAADYWRLNPIHPQN